MRFFFLLFFIINLSFASLSLKNQKSIDDHILQSLDIPRSFLYTKNFRVMKKEFERYKRHHFFDVSRVETYFVPGLIKIINAQNVPDVFLFMALAESNFAVHARSKKRAVGLWQFMPATARKFGLRVDEFVDERKDPYKSTNAAISYLKYLHTMFGKWYLAALAYNCGEGRVLKAIKRAGTDDIVTLVDPKKRYLPRESRRYIYKIVMFALMANDPEYKLNSDLAYILLRGEEYDVMPVSVDGMQPLDSIATAMKLQYHYLKELNPHIKRGFTPPVKKYTIYIPQIKFKDFKKNYKSINIAKGFMIYKVKKGDSLYSISKKFHISVSLLKKFNKIRHNLIRIKQKLIIPVPKHMVNKRGMRIYHVKRGDTLARIARKYGVTLKKLKRWNKKRDNRLKIGERIVIYN